MSLIDIILMLGAVVAAVAVSLVCALGLVVWLAGGKLDQRKDQRTA